MLEKIKENGTEYYILKSTDRLFRANKDSSVEVRNRSLYTFEQEDAATYGIVGRYKSTRENIMLFAMDSPNNIEVFKGYANQLPSDERDDILTALSLTFQVYGNEVIRNSEPEDKLIADFLCELGLAGFASKPLKKSIDSSEYFHGECMLCNAEDYIEFDGKCVVSK